MENLQNKPVAKKKRLAKIIAVVAVVLLIGIGIGGYFLSKNQGTVQGEDTDGEALYLSPQSDLSFMQQPNGNPLQEAVSGARNTNEPNQPAPSLPIVPPAVTTKTYTSNALGFTIQIPGDWVVEATGSEVVLKTPTNTRYSIQRYATQNADNNSLKSFLQAQPNLHNVSEATIVGHQGFSFTVDGIYGRGFAFLSNGKMYYLLGTGIENSAIAQTFKIL